MNLRHYIKGELNLAIGDSGVSGVPVLALRGTVAWEYPCGGDEVGRRRLNR